MIKIGDFAKICNVTTQTLRYYDSQGILKADLVDGSSGYRFYSVEAVEKYKQILFYKNLGFSLEEIKQIQQATNRQLETILQAKREELSHSVERFREQIQTLNQMIGSQTLKPTLSEILFLPFEDHPQVLGKWELCGELLEPITLAYGTVLDERVDKQIVFMPGGAFAWKYFWTKGTLYRISHKYKFAIPNSYELIERDGERYMILHFMSDDCIDNGEDTTVLLYRQTDNRRYTERQIRPNADKTDLPYREDNEVLGEWKVCDLVYQMEDFEPTQKRCRQNQLYVLKIAFLPRGICTKTIRTREGSGEEMLRYTKGFVLNDREMTAEAYQILWVNQKEYLFVQHKSGDYTYGGKTPLWYVFERKEG